MGFSMFFVGLGCLTGPPLAGEGVTGIAENNNVGKNHFPDVSNKRHVFCTFKSLCARSLKKSMSRDVFCIFLGFGVPGVVSVPVFIVDFG